MDQQIQPKTSKVHVCGDGTQDSYEFENGYSASVIRTSFSYGGPELYELAVVKDGKVCYDSGITSDVMGWLSEAEVQETLHKIKALAPVQEEVTDGEEQN